MMQTFFATTCKGCKDYGNRQTDTVKVDLDKLRTQPAPGKENSAPAPAMAKIEAEKAMLMQQRAEEERLRRLEEEEARQRAEEEEERRRQEEERQRQLEEMRRRQAEEEEIARQLKAKEARRAAKAEREEQARLVAERQRQAEEERLRAIEEEARRCQEEEEERQRQEQIALEQKYLRRLQEFLESAGFQTPDEKKVKKGMIGSTFYYPLHAAVEANDVEAVALLLWAGADPQTQNSKKQTPLALAQAKNKKGSHKQVIATLQN